MSCSILTSESLARLVDQKLTDEERDAMRRHLDTACSDCVERLSSMGGEEFVVILGGTSACLSDQEKDALFDFAFADHHSARGASPSAQAGQDICHQSPSPTPSQRRSRSRSRSRSRWILGTGVAAGFLAAAASLVLTVFSPEIPGGGPMPAWDGTKGVSDGVVHVELRARAATREDGVPVLGRSLKGGDVLSAGEQVLLRYSLNAQARIHLRILRGAEAETVFSSAEEISAGEHEVAANGMALALEPSVVGPRFRVALIAVPTGVSLDRASLAAVKTRAELHEICARCGWSEIELESARTHHGSGLESDRMGGGRIP